MAGIIGAKHNNDSLNFSGVCQAVTLVSLRVTAADGYSNTERISNALVYAESCDIPIVNISMGLDGLRDLPAIVNLTVLDYTGLIISCAGNKNEGLYEHIADLPEGWETDRIIIVGASTSADAKWSWSNYDEEMVDLFAPGDAVLSC